MNSRIIATSIFLLSMPLISLADEPGQENTRFNAGAFEAFMMNGKPWVKLDPQSKVMYLVGLENGAVLLIAEMDNERTEKKEAKSAYPAFERLTIKGFRFSDIVEEIDDFYEQASNRRIPVVDAYRHVLKKFRGAPPEVLARDQSALREKYNR